MLVVADTSPIVVLANIECLHVLPVLFEQVAVPPQIIQELSRPTRSAPVRALMANVPSWLLEKPPVSVLSIPLLDPGESAAISVALEINADLVLIDETAGRKAALSRGLHVTGAIGVLEMAAVANLIDLADAFA